jgi:outer membrane receptor protein involved in Fe transport
MDEDWTFNTNYVFQSSIPTYKMNLKDPHSFNRLDLTLSRKFAKGTGELMIGVSDVLNETGDPVYDSGFLTAMETPGRTFFGRLQIHF